MVKTVFWQGFVLYSFVPTLCENDVLLYSLAAPPVIFVAIGLGSALDGYGVRDENGTLQ